MPQTDRRPAWPTRSSRRVPLAQMPAIRRLVRQCCNFDNGYCLALDEGEGCACVQSYSCSLLCKWFREAVLPAGGFSAGRNDEALRHLRRGFCSRLK